MKALLISPRMHFKEIELGRTLNDLEDAVHGPPMIAHQADDYIVIVSAVSDPTLRNHNEIASALAEAAVYGRAVVFGADGEAWCDLSRYRLEQIHERKKRICRLKTLTKDAKRPSSRSKPKRRISPKEKSSRR